MDCDVLLVLGSDFPYTQFYPEKAIVAQIDIRGENLGRRGRLDLGLVGGVKETLAALLPSRRKKTDTAHLDHAVAHYAKARKALDELATGVPGRKPIHPQYLTRVINELAAPDAVFTCDVGSPTLWAARYLTMNGKRRLVGSFNHGSMANAMPQAIGAQLTLPGRQVISLSGDGGFSMLMGDLLTIRQRKLPVKIVVYNNGALGFVEIEMKAAGLVEYGTTLDNPDFAQMARAIGIHGIRVEDPGELPDAVGGALAHDGPALLDVVVNRQELAMPPTITLEQAEGVHSLHGQGRHQRARGRGARSGQDKSVALMKAALLIGFGGVEQLVVREVPELPDRTWPGQEPASSLHQHQSDRLEAARGGEAPGDVTGAARDPRSRRSRRRGRGWRGRHPLSRRRSGGRSGVGRIRRARGGEKEDAWAEVPASLNLVVVAAVPLVGLTGAELIDEGARPRAGDTVLVTGALGSVGRSAVHTAKSARGEGVGRRPLLAEERRRRRARSGGRRRAR